MLANRAKNRDSNKVRSASIER